MDVDSGVEGSSQVPKVKRNKVSDDEMRKVPIPPHRFTPLRENWLKIFTPIVEHLHLQIRFNLLTSSFEHLPHGATRKVLEREVLMSQVLL